MDVELVPIVLFLSVVAIAKIIGDYRTRKKLIEKGVSAEEARALLSPARSSRASSSLKWGLVTAGIGLGLVVAEVAALDRGGPAVPGLVLLFAGGALLVHAYLEPRVAARWSRTSGGGSTGAAAD